MARGAPLAFKLGFAFALALAVLLLAPARAFASMLPACEVEPAVSSMAPSPQPICEIIVSSDDVTGETTAAPICDPSGASAIAPQRILPVSDALIRAAPSCSGADEIGAAVGRTQDKAPAAPSVDAIDLAILPGPPLVPAAPYVPMALVRDDTARALPGFRRDVYHPPRVG